MLPRELAALRAEVLGHVDRFERDLGFTAPELTGMRITLLRESIEDSFDGASVGWRRRWRRRWRRWTRFWSLTR
jgi:hypothetical protein